jgi:hypothetical protein
MRVPDELVKCNLQDHVTREVLALFLDKLILTIKAIEDEVLVYTKGYIIVNYEIKNNQLLVTTVTYQYIKRGKDGSSDSI